MSPLKALLAPAVGLIKFLTTPQRFLLMALVYGAPLIVALCLILRTPGEGILGMAALLGAGTLAVLYLLLCWHLLTNAGFRGVYVAVERLSRGDLQNRTERKQQSLIWGLAYQLDDVSAGLGQPLATHRPAGHDAGGDGGGDGRARCDGQAQRREL